MTQQQIEHQGVRQRKQAKNALPNKGTLGVSTEEFVYDDNIEEVTPPSYISADGYCVILLLTLGFVVRLLWISWPDKVVFDEVHFGKFAAKYISHTMHMDVHPPLGKLLITWAGQLAGFDGNFLFEHIGDDYIAPKVPYVAMRLGPALFGLAVPVLAFFTLRRLGASKLSAMLGGYVVLFENALATQSRFILLDSFLVFFTALVILCWSSFAQRSVQQNAFSLDWWARLCFTGVALGCAVSVKWVGLAVIGTVGAATIMQLWSLIGNLSLSWRDLAKHFFARVLGLILVPAIVYLALFAVHFAYLSNGGTNSSFLSPQFGQTLHNGRAPPSLAKVGFGSTVLFRHVASGTNFLHSHDHTYPTGSKQQQVTLYAFRDANSHFKVLKPLNSRLDAPEDPVGFEQLTSGSIVRLEHTATERKLHSHDVRPPLTDNEHFNEVSCYGYKNFTGDSNDHFQITAVNPNTREDLPHGTPLYSLNQTVRLMHVTTRCLLMSSKEELPKWGFKQMEVVCSSRARYSLSLWVLESPSSDFLNATDPAERVEYEPLGFFGKFLEFNARMWTTHKSLTGSHPFESRPSEWPLLKRGIAFFGQKNSTIYLFGNFFTWWGGFLSLLTLGALYTFYLLLNQRGSYQRGSFSDIDELMDTSMFLLIGYVFHIVPFFFFSRQLYLHHYLPALYFALLALAWLFEFLVRHYRIEKVVSHLLFDESRLAGETKLASSVRACMKLMVPVAFVGIAAVTAVVFLIYSPFIYGTKMSKSYCNALKLMPSWDFSCSDYED